MIFTEAMEVELNGKLFDVEIKADQYEEYVGEQVFTFTDILQITVFDHLGDDVTEEISEAEMNEIEDLVSAHDFGEVEEE